MALTAALLCIMVITISVLCLFKVDYDTSQAYLSYKVDPYDFQTLSELHSIIPGLVLV